MRPVTRRDGLLRIMESLKQCFQIGGPRPSINNRFCLWCGYSIEIHNPGFSPEEPTTKQGRTLVKKR